MKMNLLLICIFVFLLPTHSDLYAQSEEKESNAPTKSSGFIFIPAFYYTPETKVAGGVSLIYYFRHKSDPPAARPSIIQPTFIYTQKKQIIGSLYTDLYWKNETYRLNAEISYKKYPDTFYGIGPDTKDEMAEDFTPKTFGTFVNLFRRLKPGFNIGLLYEFRNDKILEVEDDGLLAPGVILGSRGERASGAGFLLNRDTRDNIFYPTKGSFHQLSAAFFADAFGSDYRFDRFVFDLRKYLSLNQKTVLALQGFASFISGTVPFQLLSQFGGEDLMRGYYEGRYRDKQTVVLQTEVRQRLFGRFGVVGFLGFGEVADKINEFDINNIRVSLGVGVRYMWSKSEGMNVRFDVGFIGGTPGPYMTIKEAF